MTLTVTLRDLVAAVSEFAHSDEEVVATVLHMLASRRVRTLAEPPSRPEPPLLH